MSDNNKHWSVELINALAKGLPEIVPAVATIGSIVATNLRVDTNQSQLHDMQKEILELRKQLSSSPSLRAERARAAFADAKSELEDAERVLARSEKMGSSPFPKN